jgi:HPt (histidine-containing phosphotransfer) domain-containing protein
MEDDSIQPSAPQTCRERQVTNNERRIPGNSPVSEQASECLRGWTPPRLLLELAANGSGLEAELIEAFKTDTAHRLEKLRHAITNADAARLRMEAHTIKGSAWQMGADSVASMCQEIELAASQTPLAQLDERVDRLEARFVEVCRDMACTPTRPVRITEKPAFATRP